MKVFEIMSHSLGTFFSVLTCAYYFTNEFGCSVALYAVVLILSMQFTLKRIRRQSVSRKEHGELNKKVHGLMSEMFNNIKMLKLFSWEELFKNRIVKHKEQQNILSDKQREQDMYNMWVNRLID